MSNTEEPKIDVTSNNKSTQQQPKVLLLAFNLLTEVLVRKPKIFGETYFSNDFETSAFEYCISQLENIHFMRADDRECF